MSRVIGELETENAQPEEDNIKVTAARIHNFRSLKEVEVAPLQVAHILKRIDCFASVQEEVKLVGG